MTMKSAFLSFIALGVSLLGTLCYSMCFDHKFFVPVFVVLAIASVILPPIAKKHRITNNKTGKWIEIIAIIIGGFNIYSIVFAFTSLPLLVGYLGWIACGIVYSKIK